MNKKVSKNSMSARSVRKSGSCGSQTELKRSLAKTIVCEQQLGGGVHEGEPKVPTHENMNILDTIVASKRLDLRDKRGGGRFKEAISGKDKVSLIAEVKKASPSAGVIREDLDPAELASIYEASGASAISVVTDEKFFGGSIEMFQEVCEATSLPVLRKDFIIDDMQIYESKFAGASAILLIVAILEDSELRDFRELAERLGMDALVEVHDEEELRRALKSGATIIGINNRDLKTFEVDIETTLKLDVPEDVVFVSESGIRDAMDVRRLKGTADAVLVGTSILKSDDVAGKVRELSRSRPLLKVCGVQDLETAQFCEDIGVDFIGFNFYKESPRYIDPKEARKIVSKLDGIKTVALFVGDEDPVISKHFDYVQIHGDEPVIRGMAGEIRLFDLPKGEDGKMDLSKDFPYPCFVAGGLEADDVCDLDVFAVDVARGVETGGKKDFTKITKFLNNLSL